MEELIYTDVEYRKDEDGFDEKWVYVPALGEWMTEDEFYYQKSCYDAAMGDAQAYWDDHSDDDIYDDDYEDDDDFEEDEEIDYTNMTREEAMEEYNRTGVNHSEYDLNDWDDINRRLGYDLSDFLKGIK